MRASLILLYKPWFARAPSPRAQGDRFNELALFGVPCREGPAGCRFRPVGRISKARSSSSPGVNQTRWSASGIYTRRLGEDSGWSTTFAWGRRTSEGESLAAVAIESAVGLKDWTLFGRAEYAQNNELLFVGGHHGPTFDVGKVSLGAIRDFRVAPHVKLGVGALAASNFVPRPLKPFYAGDPKRAMAFLRVKVD